MMFLIIINDVAYPLKYFYLYLYYLSLIFFCIMATRTNVICCNCNVQLLQEMVMTFTLTIFVCPGFKDLHLHEKPVVLGLRATDRVGKSESIERQTYTLFGFSLDLCAIRKI